VLDQNQGERSRKENQSKNLVALSGVVGRSVPLRWVLVVAGGMVTAVSGSFLFSTSPSFPVGVHSTDSGRSGP
jgi:hypothetical protein